MKKFIALLASGILFLIAFSSVSLASPWWNHRTEAPKELLKR